jgi:hypothetical protein
LAEDQCALCLVFVSFAPTLDPFGQGTEMRCVLHACVSYVFNGTLARRKKTILGKLAIKIRVRHDTPHSLKITKRPPRIPGNGAEPRLLVRQIVAADLAESLGMKTGQQRHRDKDECRRCYGKIGRFGCYITKNITPRHGHSPTIGT